MTNLQAGQPPARRLNTPEQAVLVLPVLAGAALAVLVGLLGLSPLLVQVQQRRGQVEVLERQRRELPLLRQQLDVLLQRQAAARDQQERLLRLVAGTGALRTWLTQLNRLALRDGLAIQQVEPQPIERYTPPPPPPPSGSTSPPSASMPTSAPSDPLLAPNLEKRSALITVQGRFPQLLTFLRQLEQLQVIVIASDLELELVPPAAAPAPASAVAPAAALAAAPPVDPGAVQTRLKLTLSAYGRQP